MHSRHAAFMLVSTAAARGAWLSHRSFLSCGACEVVASTFSFSRNLCWVREKKRQSPGCCRRDLVRTLMGRAGENDAAASARKLPWYMKNINFCQKCGSKMRIELQADDTLARPTCTDTACGFVLYVNPKIVVGSVAVSEDLSSVLLVQRTIPPVGKWTLPAGYMEMGESTLEGALREAEEEANVQLDAASAELICKFSIVSACQVQILYLTHVVDASRLGAGSETSDARMFAWNDIPWEHLAFPTVGLSLRHAMDIVIPARADPTCPPHWNVLALTKLEDGSFLPTTEAASNRNRSSCDSNLNIKE